MQKTVFNDLKNIFKVTKTIELELKPIDKNNDIMEDKEINENYGGFINEGCFLDREMPKVKDMIDNTIKRDIDYNLANVKINEDLLRNYYALHVQSISDDNVDLLNEAKKKLYSDFGKQFAYKVKEGAKFISFLLSEYSHDETVYNILLPFKSKGTLFDDFIKTRKHIFSNEDKHGTVSFRLLDENINLYIYNIGVFNQALDIITKTSSFNKENVNIWSTIEGYNSVLTQSSILSYNASIGEYNMAINEYNSKLGKETKKIPLFKALNKMILSDGENISFYNEVYTNNAAMFKDVCNIYATLEKSFEKFADTLRGFNNFDLKYVYVSNKSIEGISSKMYGDYSLIGGLLKKNGFSKTESISVDNLNKCLCETNKKFDDYINIVFNWDNNGNSVFKLIKDSFNSLTCLQKGNDETVLTDEDKVSLNEFMNLINDFKFFIKPFIISDTVLTDDDFYYSLNDLWETYKGYDKVYNKVRNWVTRKPYNDKQYRLYFGKSNLMNGFTHSKGERQYNAYIFRKKNYIDEYDYYLGVSHNTKMFNETPSSEEDISEFECFNFFQTDNKGFYKIYKSCNNVKYKDEDCPKLFATFNDVIKRYNLSEGASHSKDSESLEAYIKRLRNYYSEDFESLLSIEESRDVYDMVFKHFKNTIAVQASKLSTFENLYKKCDDYTIDLLCEEIEKATKATIKEWTPISKNEMYEARNDINKPLYLMKITNKDLSFAEKLEKGLRQNKRGKDSLYTTYFKKLMNCEDGYKISVGKIFYRPKTEGLNERTFRHKANVAINNKNRNNAKKQSVFPYEIVKDKRFTRNMFKLQLSFDMNSELDSPQKANKIINETVIEKIKNGEIKHILGIDRGERNLLYATLIDFNGNIILQKALDKIGNVDYNELLTYREKDNKLRKKSWQTNGSIKELKNGFLSNAINEIVKIVFEYNAIIVMEDLTNGFKHSRSKVEKQVYENFEESLTKKLSFCYLKGYNTESNGSRDAYQLSCPKDKIDNNSQNGIIFYVNPSYTSKIDPVSGFINVFNTRYENVKKTISFFEAFDDITYDENNENFIFNADLTKFKNNVTLPSGMKTNWKLSTHGERIRTYCDDKHANHWANENIILSDYFKKTFDELNINYRNNIKEQITSLKEKKDFEKLLECMKLMLQMRNSIINSKVDYIISPVVDENGNYYDSRRSDGLLPIDADANGAFNIARKGLLTTRNLYNNTKKIIVDKKQWLNFVQNNFCKP